MYKSLVLLILFALTFSGCTGRMVGGRCDYETVIGTVLISQKQDGPLAQFFPAGKGFEQSKVRFSPEMDFQVRQPTDSKRSDIPYPAELSAITKGSCTPYRLELLSSEYFSRGIFLSFNDSGQLTAAAQTRFDQLLLIFHRLDQSWPYLVIELCWQAGQRGSENYFQQIDRLLAQQGVPETQIHSAAVSESPWPGRSLSATEETGGVWFRFLLTGIDQLGQADLDAANNGDPAAKRKLLELLNTETTSAPDKKLAAQWVAKAAEEVNPAAQYAIGLAYLQENGVASDVTRGVDWITTAAYNDYPPAQRELGWMYYYGDIIEQDHARAYAWLLIAAENGDAEAQHEVGEYEAYVESALEYSTQDLETGKAISQSLRVIIKPE